MGAVIPGDVFIAGVRDNTDNAAQRFLAADDIPDAGKGVWNVGS